MLDTKKIEIGWGTMWRIAAFLGIIYLLIVARSAVAVFLVSAVISLGLDPFVSYLERMKIPRILGTFVVFIFGIIILATAAYFVVPILLSEFQNFVSYFGSVSYSLFGIQIPSVPFESISQHWQEALGIIGLSGASIGSAVSSIFFQGFLVVATIVSSFYLTFDAAVLERVIKALVPNIQEKNALALFGNFKKRIRRWFSTQLLLCLIMGLITGGGMWMLGVPYAFVIGILGGIFELVPMIGPVIVGAAAFFIAVSESFSLGIYALVFFMILQQLENHVLLPLVMGRAMRVHPLLVILSILAGGQIAGFIGILLAVPLAVLIEEVVTYVGEQRKLQ
jgi:predicted PurR-regulated permease PerM